MKKEIAATYVGFSQDGEIIDSFNLHEGDTLKIQEQGKKEKQKKYLKNQTELGKLERELGGFYMLYYSEKLFDGVVSDNHIARIIYLATFIEYNTNRLVFQEHGKTNKIFRERDISIVLGLERRTYNDFKKEMTTNGIMEFKEDGIYLSSIYFNKGEEKHRKQFFIKMYIDTIRQLYEQTSTRQHKTLGYLFRLIPFIEYEYNILTFSPNTDNRIKERAMTKNDIAKLLDVDIKTYEKIEKQLLKLTITFMGQQYPILGAIYIKKFDVDEGVIRKANCYSVNPLIYSSISDCEMIHEVSKKLWLKI